MTSGHVVRTTDQADFATPGGWASAAAGYQRWNAIDEAGGAVHTGFGLCRLDPGGSLPTHVHSFEESFYLVEGSAVVETPEGACRVDAGDYGFFPVGVPHRWRNDGTEHVQWAEMQGPAPRARYDDDTLLVHPLPGAAPAAIDVRDPRTRRFGNITSDHMNVGKQGQDLLAVSASMRTALLVYSGITVKMMVDTDLGAQLSTMFMVQYAPDGVAGAHDHPFEETYYFLEGQAEATFDGNRYELGPGDVAWAAVGCMHSFRNLGGGPLRWLETQSPQPPPRHSYRFARDWDYLKEKHT
jgi:mannose-6-phosphate isomerase-like protein (cupin superfamily)